MGDVPVAQRLALGYAETLGKSSCGQVADQHLEREHLHLAHQLLAHIETAHEVRGYADFGQAQHQVFRDAVVQDTLAGDHAGFLVVEGAGIVLEILDQSARLRAFEQVLGLAFVNSSASHLRSSNRRQANIATGSASAGRRNCLRVGHA